MTKQKLVEIGYFNETNHGCNQISDEMAEYYNYQPCFETGDRSRHIYLMLFEERIDSVLRKDYSYHSKFGSAITQYSKQSIRDLVYIVDYSLHQIEQKSQSIEWIGDIKRASVQREKRPDFIGLLLQRYDASYWAKEVANELKRELENFIFYLRKDLRIISVRILISVPDFYGDLTDD